MDALVNAVKRIPEGSSKTVTPQYARSIARAMMVRVHKYRHPHAILYHDGDFLVRRMTPAYKISFPEWWNDHFRYVLVGVYDAQADLEAVAEDILDTYRGDYALPRTCVRKASAGG
jgi:hypothetical protein